MHDVRAEPRGQRHVVCADSGQGQGQQGGPDDSPNDPSDITRKHRDAATRKQDKDCRNFLVESGFTFDAARKKVADERFDTWAKGNAEVTSALSSKKKVYWTTDARPDGHVRKSWTALNTIINSKKKVYWTTDALADGHLHHVWTPGDAKKNVDDAKSDAQAKGDTVLSPKLTSKKKVSWTCDACPDGHVRKPWTAGNTTTTSKKNLTWTTRAVPDSHPHKWWSA